MTQPPVDTQFEHPLARLTLRRYPRLRNETLRAWDGADLYLLDEYLNLGAAEPGAPLVLNDQCGALALSLRAARRAAQRGGDVCSSGDSWLARAALRANARDNDIDLPDDRWRWPLDPWSRTPSVVLIRVPKQMALLEAQLSRLGELPAGTPVLLAWMDKHLPGGLVDRVRHYLGPLTLLRGRYKAHGLRAEIPAHPVPSAPYPTRVAVPEQDWSLTVHAGVFAQQQLDIGARLFMASVPRGVTGPIADLGCGNGVIGMTAARLNPGASVTFCDESWLAVESARENMQRYLPEQTAHFHLGHGLSGLDEGPERFALILLNPPFHRGHAVDDRVARMLFRQAAQRLLPGGVLQVIGNRHLRYDSILQRHFAQVRQIGGDSRFVILAASAPKPV